MSFVDNEDRDLLGGDDAGEQGSDESEHLGDGVGHRRIAEGEADLPKELHEGTGGGDECDDPILGRVKPCGGGAEECAFPRADITDDDGGQAVGDGVVETIDEGRETGQGEEVPDGDILVEGLAGEAPCVDEGNHDEAPAEGDGPKSDPERGASSGGGGGEGTISVVRFAERRTRVLAARSRRTRC